ncbi:MAG: Hint domain-containing protein, partial [Pseudomonadota bacterium]
MVEVMGDMWGLATIPEPGAGNSLFACAWGQVSVNGKRAVPEDQLQVQVGTSWSWHGALWRLDAPDGPLRLEGAIGRAALHQSAERRAARLVRLRNVGRQASETVRARPPVEEYSEARSGIHSGSVREITHGNTSEAMARSETQQPFDLTTIADAFVFHGMPSHSGATAPAAPLPVVSTPTPFERQDGHAVEPASLLRDAFVVTDGERTWSVSLLPQTARSPALALFEGAVPPRDTTLWVLSTRMGAGRAAPRGGFGFGAGTLIETPEGPRPVQELSTGHTVITEDGPRRIQEFRICLAARAIVISPGFFGDDGPAAPVLVGRDSWIGFEGLALDALFSETEALVRAGDLETQPGVRLLGPALLFAISTDR